MEALTLPICKTSTCLTPPFTNPDVTTLTGLDDLGPQAVGQYLAPDQAVLACRVVAEDRWCRACGSGPTEAITGRLEHLRGTALGFHHLTHHIARSLLEAGGFKRRLHR
ncbi:hypothetical protein MOPEL_020_00090 [Mobilicoccus pelagius NBRC 104925]|uniref:Transposase n=1 Tax=Mobilicoccus pelagius NBRC 104925 TaxID=1089455 RepID=H5UP65_9MICO|nr:hypothetical protein MOPEL_020_00090 [Mobilicoccus pelagius NBRC 104925]